MLLVGKIFWTSLVVFCLSRAVSSVEDDLGVDNFITGVFIPFVGSIAGITMIVSAIARIWV